MKNEEEGDALVEERDQGDGERWHSDPITVSTRKAITKKYVETMKQLHGAASNSIDPKMTAIAAHISQMMAMIRVLGGKV